MGKFRIRRLLGLGVAFCGLTVFVAADGEKKPAAAPVELKVVKTLDDLMKVEPIAVGDEQVRLGIEAAICAEGSGVLVYCRPVSKHVNFGPRLRSGEDGLGPVQVRMVYPRVREGLPKLVEIIREVYQELDEPALFVLAARPDRAGPFEIQVLAGEMVIAKAKMETAKAQPPAWLTFEISKPEDANPPRYVLSSRTGAPSYDGLQPRAAKAALPKFMPDAPDADLDVGMKDGLVTVKCKKWIESSVPEQWLIRWWVNGKPAVIQAAVQHQLESRAIALEEMREPVEFQFGLDIDRKMLGAAAGDRLEFQLLYCPGGIRYDNAAKMMMDFAVSEENPVRLSRKINWNP